MKDTLLTAIFLFTIMATLSAQSIHRSVCQGNLERVDSLLAHTTVDVPDGRGRTPLHWAVACKRKELFDYLLKKDADVNAKDNQGKTAMHFAVEFNNTEFLDYLLKAQPNDDWQSNYGVELLELAVLKEQRVLLEKLVKSGVDINGTNKRGSTALEISERLGFEEISAYLSSAGADTTLVRAFEMKGKYMGQKAALEKAEMFAPNFVSTEEMEFGSVFNAAGDEFYLGIDAFGKNEIRFSKMVEGKWTKPQTIISDDKYSYNDPFLSNDEQRLYFISNRALDAQGDSKDIDIWYVEREGDEWSEPINAGPNINTSGDEYYISFTDSGTMYFASDGHARSDESRTDHDIYNSAFREGEFQQPVLLDTAINTTNYEADVFVAPDESYIIFCSTRPGGFGRGDLYISFKNEAGNWTTAVNMGESVNTGEYEYCPFVSKDGRFLFFTSNQDIYQISASIIEEIKQRNK